jgi:3-oxoacyl-(acyl-carrier-protein) synthase
MVYINGIGSVSIRNQKPMVIPDTKETKLIRFQEPDFSAYFSPMVSRRMSKIIKRAIVSSKMALADAGLEMPDAIISGTGLGCIEDTEKFLTAMLQNNETLLQPTHFIQSTHNTISSQIAMHLKCYGYNNTFSHLGVSFESALLDAFLQIEIGTCQNVLVGGHDEMTPNYYLMLEKLRFWEHCNAGEGCTSFILSNQKTEKSYCKIEAVHLFYKPKFKTTIRKEVESFLQKSNTNLDDIDLVMMGINSDPANDAIYDSIYLKYRYLKKFDFKQYCGDYFTASAQGVAFIAEVLKSQQDPEEYLNFNNPLRRILFHQHFHNQAHALILFSLC